MVASPVLGADPERGAGSSPAMGTRNSIIEVGSNGAYPPHNGILYDLSCWTLMRKRYLPEPRCWK